MAQRVTRGVQIAGYRRDDVEVDPPYLHPDYVATRTRSPKRPLLLLPHTLSEITGPVYGHDRIGELDHDLTRQHDGEPIGERIILHGRVLDGDGRPVRGTLVEIWQANAAGRYKHVVDGHPAPLDPNFTGAGRCLTNDRGEYRYLTIKPGAYPWLNHPNAWRPAHIHLSLFGPSFVTRLVTQFFFPGDPLIPLDPILNSVPTKSGRERLMSSYAHDVSEPEFALGYRFDIVLRGRKATPFEGSR